METSSLSKEITKYVVLLTAWYVIVYFTRLTSKPETFSLGSLMTMVSLFFFLMLIMTLLPIRLYLRILGFYLVVPTLTILGFLEFMAYLGAHGIPYDEQVQGGIVMAFVLAGLVGVAGPIEIIRREEKESDRQIKRVLFRAVVFTMILVPVAVPEPLPRFPMRYAYPFYFGVANRQIPYLIGVIWFLVVIELLIRRKGGEYPHISERETAYAGFVTLAASVVMLVLGARVMFMEEENLMRWVYTCIPGLEGLLVSSLFFMASSEREETTISQRIKKTFRKRK